MNTPLPEKLGDKPAKDDESGLVYELMNNQDQIITYLAELTEVVDGKQTYAIGLDFAKEEKAPTLKETELYRLSVKEMLLDELFCTRSYKKNKTVDEIEENVVYVKYHDIEAIINRLIP